MKKYYLLITLSCLLSKKIFSQENFEGFIKFRFEANDKKGEISQSQMKEYLGNEQTYYLKKNKYKSQMNGLLKITNYYNGNDTVYMKMNGEESLLYRIVSNEVEEKVISHKFSDLRDTIAGIPCKLLIVKTNKGIHKYFYSNEITIDPKFYKNHKLGLWNYFMKVTNGGISIRSEADLKDGYQKIEVISFERMKLNDSIFNRPKDLSLKRMPNY